MGINFFKKPASPTDFYDVKDQVNEGVDLRRELHDLLYTENRGAEVIYRRVKMENGVPKKCECTKTSRSQEPNRDIPCSNCNGMGYYFTDILTRSYINHSQAYAIYKKYKEEGASQVEYRTTYFEWDFLKTTVDDGDNIPNRFDRIIQLKKDLEGKILSPSMSREFFEILSVDPYRLDNNGRIEYYRCRVISVIDKSFLT